MTSFGELFAPVFKRIPKSKAALELFSVQMQTAYAQRRRVETSGGCTSNRTFLV